MLFNNYKFSIFSSNVLGSSYNPLDSTLVHPESYALAEKIVQLEGFRLDQIGTPPFVSHFKSINAIKFATKIKPEELAKTPQILEALGLQLEFDIRDEKAKPTFRRDVISADNLRSGFEFCIFYYNIQALIPNYILRHGINWRCSECNTLRSFCRYRCRC